jgi:hypothetical protein
VAFAPRAPGVVFRSRLERGTPPAPDAPGAFALVTARGGWTVLRRCRTA